MCDWTVQNSMLNCSEVGLVSQIDTDRKKFYSSHVFHERHMNSCPIGCEGCAVSASTSKKGSIAYADLLEFYQDAASFGVALNITKVEGYDPVFVNYSDDSNIPFAKSVVDAIDLGHQIITPICTTGSWKAPRTQWQLAELGKLGPKYRYYRYPSGRDGQAYSLSVPREIKPFAGERYNYDDHIAKLLIDIQLLTANGELDALVYFNSNIDGDIKIAQGIQRDLSANLPQEVLVKTQILITEFNSSTLPESCYRYPNSVLITDTELIPIDLEKMDWDEAFRLGSEVSFA